MKQNSSSVELDPKYKIFADTFIITGRKGESAAKAGFAKNSAHVTANRLLKRPDVQEYLRTQANKVTEQTEDLQSRVLKELETMAFANIADFITVDENGQPQVDFSTATPEQLRAITRVASKRKTTKSRSGDVILEEESSFAMADKYRGLELLGNHLGLFKNNEQKVVIDVADRLLVARQRLLSVTDGATE